MLASLGLTVPASGTFGALFAGSLLGGSAIAALLGLACGPTGVSPWTTLVSLVLWQPLLEELLFRGVLQSELLRVTRLARSRFGLTGANLLASAAFVAAHLVNQPPGWALAVLVPSLLFGFFRDRSGSVVPGLLLHAAYNAAFFLVH